MNPAIFVLFSMLVTSLTLVALLSIAWASFGQPRHALIWAAAYGAAAAQWAATIAFEVIWPGSFIGRPITLALGAIGAVLLTLGFRQRAGLTPRTMVLTGLAVGCILCTTHASMAWRGGAIDRATLPLFIAATHVLSASTLVGRDWAANVTERSMFGILLLFASYYLGLAVMALGQGSASAAELMAHATLQMLGTPAAFLVTGLFAVFLIASDLAERMRRLAILDPLTGILNRRGLEQAAEAAIANSRRGTLPLSVVLADLDRFKQINDTLGHAAGDRALRQFTAHVERAIRKGDLFGRLGGEEFAVVLTNAGSPTAMEVAERVRVGLAQLDLGVDDMRLTSSFGVTSLLPEDAGFAALLGRADGALYRSKLEGRNRVTLAELPPPPDEPAATAESRRAPPQPAPLH